VIAGFPAARFCPSDELRYLLRNRFHIHFLRSSSLILHTTVSFAYDGPWRKVHELLIDAAEIPANILKDPKPFVLQTSLDDFYVSHKINAFTDQPNLMAARYSELHKSIQDKFNEAGVKIMSPHFTTVRDGNRTAIPDDHLPKTYQPRPFRVALPRVQDRDEPR
jgi:small-conductance mechanosensitive channel